TGAPPAPSTIQGASTRAREKEAEDLAATPPEWRGRFLYCLRVFLGARVGLALLALVATALLPANAAVHVPGWDAPNPGPGWENLFTAWERWDALWFLRIATEGYSDTDLSAAFFPFYPLLIRGISPLLGGHPLAAALLISNLAYLGALFAMYELTRTEFDDDRARRSVLYMAVFPTAFFFFAPYTESLFLLLTVGSLLAARRREWALAGTLGALAAATRSIGIVLILPLALEAWDQARSRDEGRIRSLVRTLPWAAFPVTGLLTYLFYWYRSNGDWLTPVRDQSGWLREFHFVWDSIVKGTEEALKFIGAYSGGFHQLDLIVVAVAIAAAVWVVRNVRAPYVAYTVLSLLIPLSFIFGGRPFMSVPRFVVVIFPLFWAFAAFAERYRAHDLVVAVSAAGLGVMTVLYVNWYFVF
ncbi:MAG: mannosyltransferase family protein, partial [Actinomycetota bacterium]